MLTAYVDDSGTHGGPYCFVGGYISSVESWQRFAEEWRPICSEYLGDVPFKTSLAYRDKDPGFIPEEGRIRLAQCIVKHAEIEVWSVLPQRDSEEIQRKYGARFDRYWTCFTGLIEEVTNDYYLSKNPDSLNWIFDHQGRGCEDPDELSKLEYSLLRAFNQYKTSMKGIEKRFLRTITFGDDLEICQLQAADFLVWQKQRAQKEGCDVDERPECKILTTANIHRIHFVWFNHRLEDRLRRLVLENDTERIREWIKPA